MFLKIRKGDFSTYTLKILEMGREQPKDNYGNNRYHYQMQNLLSGDIVTFDASAVAHKILQTFRKGDVIDVRYKDIGQGKTQFVAEFHADHAPKPSPALSVSQNPPNRPQPQDNVPLPPKPPGTPNYQGPAPTLTREAQMQARFKEKDSNIQISLAVKLALESLSEKDKERTFSEIKVLLPERERYFLGRLESELRAEMDEEKMDKPENKPGFIEQLTKEKLEEAGY